ncbi:hypothetical protein CLTEP_14840 [Clostridium tepidiprofundi DSM 19306]|uniref:Uncharacterized protein n=1 Tax=Clostridium tepidiprofundi DSM 19306 TaxID=1121338 RepID=A0A151B3T7_9CLOT|nr:hypothetical protein [Clostridium tepidiprofundi]KYH34556.1 hypothetical protein CLTEP_14840 [Clostridium tepidiprofundi DSM 19306]
MQWLKLSLVILIILIIIIKDKAKKILLSALAIAILVAILCLYNTLSQQKTFYNCLSIYCNIMEDVKQDLFTTEGEYKEIDKTGHYLFRTSDKIRPATEIMNRMSMLNFKLNISDYSFLSYYFMRLSDCCYDTDGKLSPEEIKILKEILHRSGLINTYIISSENYRKDFDSVKPVYRIRDELNKIKELSKKAIYIIREESEKESDSTY